MCRPCFLSTPRIPHIILGKPCCCLDLHYLVFVEKPNGIFKHLFPRGVEQLWKAVLVFCLQNIDTGLCMSHVGVKILNDQG